MVDVDVLRATYQHRAARLLVNVSRQIQNDVTMEGKTFEDALRNGALFQMGRVSLTESAYLLFDGPPKTSDRTRAWI